MAEDCAYATRLQQFASGRMVSCQPLYSLLIIRTAKMTVPETILEFQLL